MSRTTTLLTVLSLALTLPATAAPFEVLSSAQDLANKAQARVNKAARVSNVLDFNTKTLDGKPVNLSEKYAGKVVLLVNVASRCGLTPQYEELQALHKKYAERGLAIVGVPCNQFRGQEPGSADEILTFCEKNYGVEFDLLEKQNVKLSMPNQSPLYKLLTAKETGGEFAGDIGWNFEKFLFSREGDVIARFDPRTKPMAKPVVSAIESELAKPAPESASNPAE